MAQRRRRGDPFPIRVEALDIEKCTGLPLGDVRVSCLACGKHLSAIEKLHLIIHDGPAWYEQGKFEAFCERCQTAYRV